MHMQQFITVTSQGQITIPASSRRKFQVDKAGKLLFREHKKSMILTPVSDIDSLMGSLHTSKKLTRAQERKVFEDAIGKGEA